MVNQNYGFLMFVVWTSFLSSLVFTYKKIEGGKKKVSFMSYGGNVEITAGSSFITAC